MSRQGKGLKKQESRKEYFERLIAWAVSVVYAAEHEVTVSAVIDQLGGKKMHVRDALLIKLQAAFDSSEEDGHLRRPVKLPPIVTGLLALRADPNEEDLVHVSSRLQDLSSHTRDGLIDALIMFQDMPQPKGSAFGQVGDAIAALERLDGDPDVKYAMTMGRYGEVAEALESETWARMAPKRGRAGAGGQG